MTWTASALGAWRNDINTLDEMPPDEIGFGAMRLSGDTPFKPAPSKTQAFRTLDAVVSCGITFIDTADTYGLGQNESLLGEYLRSRPDKELRLCTKVGQCHDGSGRWTPLGNPRYLRQQAHGSLQRLGVGQVDALLLHRLDPQYPASEQLGVLEEFLDRGQTRAIGVSGVDAHSLGALAASFRIRFVQNRQSLATGVDRELAAVCQEFGITLVAYAPLDLGVERLSLKRVAARWGMTPQQLSLRWALSHKGVLPIPGSSMAEHVTEWAAATLEPLPDAVLQEISSIIYRRGENEC